VLTLIEGDTLKMVATDGRRLALISSAIDAGGNGDGDRRAIVPTKGMQLFTRVLSDPLEQIKLHFGENQLGLKTSRAEVFARLIDGEFPNYQAVLPPSTTNKMEADTGLLQQKLRLVANVTSSDTRAVRLSMEKGRTNIHGRSSTMGEASAQIECHFEGEECNIAFNPDYVIEGLKNCELDSVRLEFNERTSPGKFTLGENYIYIVMPITVDA